jgi:hypothetical protein
LHISPSVTVFAIVGVVFFLMAKFNARPGFNAVALGIVLAMTPLFSPLLPGHGDLRDATTVFLMMIVASIGTALGGGLKPHDDPDPDHAALFGEDTPDADVTRNGK